MSVEQIMRYCAVMGEKMAKRTVYDYLGKVKLPKRYDKSGRHQSHHDYMTFESFLKIAEGIREAGYEVSVVSFNRAPGDGAKFRFDFKYRIGKYLFYGEVQLSDIAGTNWRTKHRNYIRWYERNNFPFRVLMVIDQKRDMSTIRGHAREVLRSHPKLNLFLYCTLEDLRNCGNAATEPIWKDKGGTRMAVIQS